MGDDNGIVVVPRVILAGAIAPVASTPCRRRRRQPPTAEAIYNVIRSDPRAFGFRGWVDGGTAAGDRADTLTRTPTN